jgi:hypothetical protein
MLICCKAIAIAIPFRVMLDVIGLVFEESAKKYFGLNALFNIVNILHTLV